MKSEEYSPDCPGSLVRIPEGIHAFVPDPLPPSQPQMDGILANQVAEAALALGELRGIGATLPNPHLLIHPLRTREALLSSKLEGTLTTAEELIIADAPQARRRVRDATLEVQNYVRALEYGLGRLEDLPVSNRLIREVHERLMQGVRGQERNPGSFRTTQNFIGQRGQSIEQSRFIPPPVPDMKRSMDALEVYMHAEHAFHPLIQLALIHYQFETIHPFDDGNGRIGRLLIILLMCDWKLLKQPLLYMSAYFEKNEDIYRDYLLEISRRGSWREWIDFFLTGVVEQSRDAIDRSDRLLKLQSEYRDKVQSTRTSALALKLVDHLLYSPWTNMPTAAKLLGVTPAAAQNNINKLVDMGILYEVTGRQRDRIYLARGVLEVINK